MTARAAPQVERRLLQLAVALACLIPIGTALTGIFEGAAMIHGVGRPVPADLDSHYRYLSGLFLVMGLGFASCVPRIEVKGPRFRLLAAMAVTGGLARAWSWYEVAAPSLGHRLGLAMELAVVPLLLLWQTRVARRAGRPLPPSR